MWFLYSSKLWVAQLVADPNWWILPMDKIRQPSQIAVTFEPMNWLLNTFSFRISYEGAKLFVSVILLQLWLFRLFGCGYEEDSFLADSFRVDLSHLEPQNHITLVS